MRRCDCGVLNYTNCLVLGFTRHICNSLVLTIFVARSFSTLDLPDLLEVIQ